MKFSVGAVTLFVVGTSAFSPASGPASRTALNTATMEAPAEEKTAAPQMTRFDRLKKNYKGFQKPVEDGEVEELSFSYDDFETAVAETTYSFERHAIVKGQCIEYEAKGVIVDIGAKASAYLPEAEAALIQPVGSVVNDLVNLNEELDFQIISDEDENGQLLVSIRRIQYRSAWETILQMQADDAILEAEVVSVNRGGAICLVEGLRAFLPGSHLAGKMATEELIGEVLPLKFLEVNQENNKLVVSNRKAVVETQMADLSRGDLVEGVVQALKPYGAFIEVGGMSGLLHISQISYDRIEDLEQVLQPGMAVKCMIIDHDKVNGRIALSTKTLEPSPGDMLRDSSKVFDMAEESAEKYHTKMEEERKARESAARDIVLGLGDSLDGLGDDLNGEPASASSDPLADVSDSLDSLLS
jgi:small subunit ribosomal protein S1|uniref:S1 motif domain-containing protein n=2 Tax=Pseudo-nitzschia delicatissima TaxID=44447 RepID=A0A7S0Y7D5_9STRA|mmetsp:Transcript_2076/g.4351  ORF Transcript_2076/g.4351 Transcript_2076/m.4351 type:complete len:414 (+) Transcript_2076:107-1348(+)